MSKYMNLRIMPLIFLLVIAGVIATALGGTWVICGLIAASLIAVAVSFLSKRLRKYFIYSLMVFVTLLMSFIGSAVTVSIYSEESERYENTSLCGVVSSLNSFDASGAIDDDASAVYLDNISVVYDGEVRRLDGRAYVDGVFENLHLGDKLTVTVNMTKTGVNPLNQYDIGAYRDNVRYTAELIRVDSVEKGELDFVSSVKLAVKKVYAKYAAGETGDFMFAMLFGDKSGISSGVAGDFAATGLSHLLAVSGLHVGMIALSIMYLLKRAGLRDWIKFIVLAVCLIGYNLLCGFSPSVVRASIMILVCYIARFIGLRNDSISTLSFAGIIILLIFPYYLFDMSFVMSFLAVVGLVYFYKSINNRLKFLPRTLRDVTTASLAANIGLLPVMVYYFQGVSAVFLFANVAILPVISVIFPIAVPLTVVGMIPFLGYILVPISAVMRGVLEAVNSIAGLNFIVLEMNIEWCIIALYVIALTVLSPYVMIKDKYKRISASLMICSAGVTAILTSPSVLPRNDIYLYADSGYTDGVAALITTDDREYKIVLSGADARAIDLIISSIGARNIRDIDELIVFPMDIADESGRKAVEKICDAVNIKQIAAYENTDEFLLSLNIPIFVSRAGPPGVGGFYSEREYYLKIGDSAALFSRGDKVDTYAYHAFAPCIVVGKESSLPYKRASEPQYIFSNAGYYLYEQNTYKIGGRARLNGERVKFSPGIQ